MKRGRWDYDIEWQKLCGDGELMIVANNGMAGKDEAIYGSNEEDLPITADVDRKKKLEDMMDGKKMMKIDKFKKDGSTMMMQRMMDQNIDQMKVIY